MREPAVDELMPVLEVDAEQQGRPRVQIRAKTNAFARVLGAPRPRSCAAAAYPPIREKCEALFAANSLRPPVLCLLLSRGRARRRRAGRT
jgi:hypothetical protein